VHLVSTPNPVGQDPGFGDPDDTRNEIKWMSACGLGKIYQPASYVEMRNSKRPFAGEDSLSLRFQS
jgi:hypothetical protein